MKRRSWSSGSSARCKLRTPLPLAVMAVIVAAACAPSRPSPYLTSRCPIPPALRGYPVTASSADATLSPAFLRTVARAVAGHFTIERNAWEKHDGLPALVREMSVIIDRGEVFPRDQWKPAVGDTARLRLTYRAGDRQPDLRLARAENPTRFERLVLRAARTALERSRAGKLMRDTLPLVAPMSGDSAVVAVAFGREPDARSGVTRPVDRAGREQLWGRVSRSRAAGAARLSFRAGRDRLCHRAYTRAAALRVPAPATKAGGDLMPVRKGVERRRTASQVFRGS